MEAMTTHPLSWHSPKRGWPANANHPVADPRVTVTARRRTQEGSALDALAEGYRANTIEHITLRDGQALLIEGDIKRWWGRRPPCLSSCIEQHLYCAYSARLMGRAIEELSLLTCGCVVTRPDGLGPDRAIPTRPGIAHWRGRHGCRSSRGARA